MSHFDDIGLLRFESARALLARERDTRAREGPPDLPSAEELAAVICCCVGDGDGCLYDPNLAHVVECAIIREIRCCSLREVAAGRPFAHTTLALRLRSDIVLELLRRVWADVSAATGLGLEAPHTYDLRRVAADERGLQVQTLACSIARGLEHIAAGVGADWHPAQFVML